MASLSSSPGNTQFPRQRKPNPCSSPLFPAQHSLRMLPGPGWVWDPPADWQHQHKIAPCFPDPLPALGSQAGKQSFRGWEEMEEKRLLKLCKREHARRKTRARKSDWQAALSPGARLPVCSAALTTQMRLSQGKSSPSFTSPGEHRACRCVVQARVRMPSPSSSALSCFAALASALHPPLLSQINAVTF